MRPAQADRAKIQLMLINSRENITARAAASRTAEFQSADAANRVDDE
jgi:hypothetical protein